MLNKGKVCFCYGIRILWLSDFSSLIYGTLSISELSLYKINIPLGMASLKSFDPHNSVGLSSPHK